MIKILKKDEEFQGEGKHASHVMPITRTIDPTTTGSSVIGLYYKGGVIIASDTKICYGRLTMYKEVDRIAKINSYSAISSSGEYSDFQEAIRMLTDMDKSDKLHDDNVVHTPHDFSNYLARQSYAKRNKGSPLYMTSLIGGFYGGKRYLAYVDMFGALLEGTNMTTGYAGYFCKPLIANYWKEDMSEKEVKDILKECFRILYYRDSKASDRIQFCTISADGVKIEEPFVVDTKWDHKLTVTRANEKDYIF
jgi:20S proteasome subunit beta 7